jgi:hypothetical protein
MAPKKWRVVGFSAKLPRFFHPSGEKSLARQEVDRRGGRNILKIVPPPDPLFQKLFDALCFFLILIS